MGNNIIQGESTDFNARLTAAWVSWEPTSLVWYATLGLPYARSASARLSSSRLSSSGWLPTSRSCHDAIARYATARNAYVTANDGRLATYDACIAPNDAGLTSHDGRITSYDAGIAWDDANATSYVTCSCNAPAYDASLKSLRDGLTLSTTWLSPWSSWRCTRDHNAWKTWKAWKA